MIWRLDDYANNIAVIDEAGNSYSYSWLKDKCDEVVKNLKSERCLVFNLCKNQIGSLIGYIAFLNNKTVPLMLDEHINQNSLKELIMKYKPDYIWLPEEKTHEFNCYEKVYSIYDYCLIKTEYDHEYPLFEKLALLLTTSGSTGSPKLVKQSYRNIIANTESIIEYLGISESDRSITTLPMSYTYGLSIINTHIYSGAAIILTEKNLMQNEFWQHFKNYKATSFGGVPYTYEILNKLRLWNMDLPFLKTMTQAGGKLLPELQKKFAEYAVNNNKRFFVMYGQTEATARMSYLPHDKALEKNGSMGFAIPGGKLKLLDDNGEEITTADITGELVYEGENVTLGYAKSGNDLILGDERNGILITGDMAKRDLEGYYYIVGRKKRFLKIYGNRVNLDEVEQMIKEHHKIDCACAGYDDLLCIFITDNLLSEDIKAFISKKTGLNSAAFKVITIDSIPKNESGKTLYSALEDYYGK